MADGYISDFGLSVIGGYVRFARQDEARGDDPSWHWALAVVSFLSAVRGPRE